MPNASRTARHRLSPSEWEALVTQQSRSGLSQLAFCKEMGISSSTFQVWRRKLRSQRASADFVDVTPVTESVGHWTVEIELPDGTLARVRG